MAANQNVTQLTPQTGSANTTSLFYAVVSGSTDTGLPLSVLVNNLGLTGTPTTPTATTGTNTTQIASTAFVQAQLTSSLAPYAPIASPTFTGTVTIPTVTLSGGTINSTSVGATTPSTGSFTTLASSGLATLSSLSTSSATLSGGTINSMSVGATTASTGKFTTLQATSTITPSTTAGIVGTTGADNANTGSIGEYVTATQSSGVSLSNGTYANITSISLTAGDWDVSGVGIITGSATVVQNGLVGISTTSGSSGPLGYYSQVQPGGPAPDITIGVPTPVVRINVSTTTTVYLGALAGFTSGTVSATGVIRARRVR